MTEEKKSTPGDGIRSMKTSNLFRALNFELYVKPNNIVMGMGATAFVAFLGYVVYMRYKYEKMGYYPSVNVDGTEQYHKRRSNWD
ncbi:hypothetical protein RUM44_001399 [Polyplax serrata]|uniref:Small integral membrane protein 8 n=1 Tax=Polyplax serrata TaxID=468196 RepID=A0ABR1AKP0_POLSC